MASRKSAKRVEPEATASGTTVDVGGLWVFDADGRVTVTRPDGSTTEVMGRDGKARLYLTEPGTYTAGDETVTVE